jgi:colicin import membrane protein
MNTAVLREPNQVSAGVLTLVVHLVFFALLYFGVSWRSDPPQGMTVDIWNSLPTTEPVAAPPTQTSPPPQTVQPAPQPVPPPPVQTHKVDIDLGDKKKPKPSPETKPAPPKPATPPPVDAAQVAREQALQAQAAATGKIVADYTGRIKSKIRGFIPEHVLEGVPDSAQVEFDVTLLPGGDVFTVRKTRSSGNAAYDEAVERAILRAKPLPLPEGTELFGNFRELHLSFRPRE